MILVYAAGCQNSPESNLPTVFELPSATPVPTGFTPPTRSLNLVPSPATPIKTPTPIPTMTHTPSLIPTTLTPSATSPPTQTATPAPTVTPSATPTRTPLALPERFIFGQSVQGRELIAYRFGTGSGILMLIGGIHGGWESNTITLVEELIAHFQQNPTSILPEMTLILVPSLNPDGAALGAQLEGRFNANGVDLNRNWACGWEPVAYFRSQEVSPGAEPLSEPETRALAALINDIQPDTVLFYHSAASGVFEGHCGAGDSTAMAAVLGEATGYSYGEEFTSYVVTGTAPAWVNSLGIPAADVELATSNRSEFARNLRGVMALQCWITSTDPAQCPTP